MTEQNDNSQSQKEHKQLIKERIMLIIYVIAVLTVAYILDSKITAVKGQQYYDKGTTDTP